MLDFQFTNNVLGEYRCGICLSHAAMPNGIYKRISPWIVQCNQCRAVGICVGKEVNKIAWKPDWSLVDALLERGMQ